MSDVINIKDFYNHETRLSIVENAIVQIDKRFDQVDKRFEQIDKRFEQVDKRFEQIDKRLERLENESRSQFKWIMGFIFLQLSASIGIYASIIMKLH